MFLVLQKKFANFIDSEATTETIFENICYIWLFQVALCVHRTDNDFPGRFICSSNQITIFQGTSFYLVEQITIFQDFRYFCSLNRYHFFQEHFFLAAERYRFSRKPFLNIIEHISNFHEDTPSEQIFQK